MKQVLIRHGGVSVETVPNPSVTEGCVLVRVHYSCISVGTEMSGVNASNLPLWKRALKQPENVKKVYERVKTHGIKNAQRLVQQKLDAASPVGYSNSGTVIAVGMGVADFVVGQRVTCAGAQAAFHAEIVNVPQNLVCPVPESLGLKEASTVTLGAIALQGVRRANPTLGETFVVIGLGALGQLTHQLLQANGVRTIGTDINVDRIGFAEGLGLNKGLASDEDFDRAVANLTDGVGADAVIITASSSSSELISRAFKCCRRKGRVVLVGAVGLDINRDDIYTKELDFFISTSYGPGRYDKIYEEGGLDYPLPYVRWSENRNMRAYLDLLSQKRVDVGGLVRVTFPVDQAQQAYAALKGDGQMPLSVLLDYSATGTKTCTHTTNNLFKAPTKNVVSLSVIGAGGFASATLLPLIAEQKDTFGLCTIVTHRGHNGVNIARQFNAQRASTDFDAVCVEPESNALMIATRHNLHGDYAFKGLRSGKHVFVEKPTCMTLDELMKIEKVVMENGEHSPILMTGFNRRFSRYARAIAAATENRTAPMIINCRVNATFLPLDHWVHGDEGGGRNIGEACHFYDLFTFWTQSKVSSVHACAIAKSAGKYCRSDNFVATISYEDGSLATLTYTALGNDFWPKEQVDVYCDGAVYCIDDYKQFHSTNPAVKPFKTKIPEKGHRAEIIAFGQAIKNGGAWPIPMWQQSQAMRIAFLVGEQASI